MLGRSRRAFTLVDAAAALAVLLLTAAVIVPLVAGVRTRMRSATSSANLKILSRAHFAYQASNQDRWMNPFNPAATQFNSPLWYDVRTPNGASFWRFDDPNYPTEFFSMHWATLATDWFAPGNPRNTTQFDPADSSVIDRFNFSTSNVPNEQLTNYIWDGSYWYSPTMWIHQARYAGSVRPVLVSPFTFPTRSVRYNYAAEVVTPANKVFLWQRFDTTRSRALSAGETGIRRPNWNNRMSVVPVAFCDGSVDDFVASKHADRIAADPAYATAYAPTLPNWNIPQTMLFSYDMDNDGLENGQIGTAWPAYFWGTRLGIAGRDLPRR